MAAELLLADDPAESGAAHRGQCGQKARVDQIEQLLNTDAVDIGQLSGSVPVGVQGDQVNAGAGDLLQCAAIGRDVLCRQDGDRTRERFRIAHAPAAQCDFVLNRFLLLPDRLQCLLDVLRCILCAVEQVRGAFGHGLADLRIKIIIAEILLERDHIRVAAHGVQIHGVDLLLVPACLPAQNVQKKQDLFRVHALPPCRLT